MKKVQIDYELFRKLIFYHLVQMISMKKIFEMAWKKNWMH